MLKPLAASSTLHIVKPILSRNLAPMTTTAAAIAQRRFMHPSPAQSTNEIPKDLLREVQSTRPMPIRGEFLEGQQLTTDVLEHLDIGEGKHREPMTMSDRLAYRVVKMLRVIPDTYFGNNHLMRAVMLETIAAGKQH